MTPIVLEPTSTAQWQTLVRDAARANDLHLDEVLESYLVFVLMRFIERPDMASTVMAFDYLRGLLTAHGPARRERLRDVGDQCLLYSGLFPRRAARRLVRVSYYVDLGRTAYRELAEHTPEGRAELFARLAEAFVSLMDVLQSMRAMGGEPLDPLAATELWQDTGSDGVLKRLREATSGATMPAPASDDDPIH